MFWVNLPTIAIVAWAGRLAFVSIAPVERVAARTPLNWIGPLLLGVIVGSMLAAPHDSIPVAVLIPTGILAAVAFVWFERRTPNPIFTHSANAIAANVSAFAAGVVLLGAETYLPLQLQVGFHHGVTVVGIALLLCTIGWTSGSMGAARINLSTRSQVMLGTATTVVATVVMALPLGERHS